MHEMAKTIGITGRPVNRPLIQTKNRGQVIGAFQVRTITTEAEMSFEAEWPAR